MDKDKQCVVVAGLCLGPPSCCGDYRNRLRATEATCAVATEVGSSGWLLLQEG